MKEIVFVSILLFSGLNFGCARPVVMDGSSMLPNLKNGDRLLLNTNVGELRRGEIVAHLYPKDTSKWYLKRIIGLPDETVEIRQGIVFIDGKQLDEPYLDQNYNQGRDNLAPTRIEANTYFVLGDNRDNSSDSRYWGAVKRELIMGTVSIKY